MVRKREVKVDAAAEIAAVADLGREGAADADGDDIGRGGMVGRWWWAGGGRVVEMVVTMMLMERHKWEKNIGVEYQ